VAGIYFLLDYTFLGAAQISVYAGGVTMLYVFAIQLVGKRSLQGLVEQVRGSRVIFGAIMSLVGLATVLVVLFKNQFIYAAAARPDTEVPMEIIGRALVGADRYQYVLAFELISVFLLACIIGGLAVARKDSLRKEE
jgi:NADH-quinone oxidoreductase subunit J